MSTIDSVFTNINNDITLQNYTKSHVLNNNNDDNDNNDNNNNDNNDIKKNYCKICNVYGHKQTDLHFDCDNCSYTIINRKHIWCKMCKSCTFEDRQHIDICEYCDGCMAFQYGSDYDKNVKICYHIDNCDDDDDDTLHRDAMDYGDSGLYLDAMRYRDMMDSYEYEDIEPRCIDCRKLKGDPEEYNINSGIKIEYQ